VFAFRDRVSFQRIMTSPKTLDLNQTGLESTGTERAEALPKADQPQAEMERLEQLKLAESSK
jgi:hypothetical protein